MKRILLAAAITGLLLYGIMIAGCSDSDDPVSSGTTVAVASVSPSDGSTDVPVGTPVTITFTGPVDTLSIMRNLHLAGGQQMHQWQDSLNHYGGFGMMNMGMRDHMMNWIDSIHTSGDFHWNDALDSCQFYPDSSLMSGTEYLCLLYEGGMQGHGGGMMGGPNHEDSGYHIFEFTTEP